MLHLSQFFVWYSQLNYSRAHWKVLWLLNNINTEQSESIQIFKRRKCSIKHFLHLHRYFLPFATKLRRLCFYTCLSVILWTGGSASLHAGILPQEQTPLRADPPGTMHPPGADTPLREQTPAPVTRHPPRAGIPGSRHSPPSRRLLLQTVRVLLECILVWFSFMIALRFSERSVHCFMRWCLEYQWFSYFSICRKWQQQMFNSYGNFIMLFTTICKETKRKRADKWHLQIWSTQFAIWLFFSYSSNSFFLKSYFFMQVCTRFGSHNKMR